MRFLRNRINLRKRSFSLNSIICLNIAPQPHTKLLQQQIQQLNIKTKTKKKKKKKNQTKKKTQKKKKKKRKKKKTPQKKGNKKKRKQNIPPPPPQKKIK